MCSVESPAPPPLLLCVLQHLHCCGAVAITIALLHECIAVFPVVNTEDNDNLHFTIFALGGMHKVQG